MTIGIYSIRHVESGKRYIGKSKNIEKRWNAHRHEIKNRHLANAVQKCGINAFEFDIVEAFEFVDEETLADRELHWIDHFNACDRRFGYNLRRDSSSRVVFHGETIVLMSLARAKQQPFSDESRRKMSTSAKARWKKSDYRTRMLSARGERRQSAEHRANISEGGKRRWADPEHRAKLLAARSSPECRARISEGNRKRGLRRRALLALMLWLIAA